MSEVKMDQGNGLYRLIGNTHTLDGLPAAVQKFVRSIDSVRKRLAADAHLSHTELRAMSRIAEQSDINPKSLADFLELSTPAVTAITSTLVAKEMIVRMPDPTDRRRLVLELTPTGHETMQTMYRSFQAAIQDAASELGEEQLPSFTEALNTAATALEISTHGQPVE